MKDGSIIKKYIIREGVSPHLDIPEYGYALRKYPSKMREISIVLEYIYRVSTEPETCDAEYWLRKAVDIAEDSGFTLKELGLSNEEALYILDINEKAKKQKKVE